MKLGKLQLEQMYLGEQMSLKTIGDQCGVCVETVRHWLMKANIPVRPKSSPDLWNSRKEEIAFLYHHRRLSQRQIAEYYNAHSAQIQKVMKRLAIPRLGRGRRQGADHYYYKDGKSSVLYRKLIVKDQCSRCGTTEKQLGIHHKNNDHYDNRIENLEVLCNSCHMSETKKAWWAAKKAGKTYKGNARVGWQTAKKKPDHRPHSSKRMQH